MFQAQPYALLLFVAAGVSASVGTYSWRRRAVTPAAGAVTLVMCGLVWWSGAEAIGFSFTSLRVQWVFARAIYPGVCAAILGLVWFLRVMVDREWGFSRRAWVLLSVEPVFITVAAATNSWFHLLAGQPTRTDSGLVVSHDAGPAFWAHAAYNYALVGWALVAVARASRVVSRLQRRQLVATLLAAIPSFVTVTYTVAVLAVTGATVDYSAIGFVLTCLIDAWALYRLGLLNLVPVARAQILEGMGDAVVVLDPDGRVLDLNPAAGRIARALRPDLPADVVGLPARVLGFLEAADGTIDGERTVAVGRTTMSFDVRASRLLDGHGRAIGSAVVARDITELAVRRRELTEVNARLHHQIATIDALRATLAEQAVRDVLTGIHNRRHLMIALENEVTHARRSGAHLGLILLDIDHFKAVNDQHGHTVGDRLLVAIAAALAERTREGDTIARYGGEEFVVVIPGAESRQLLSRAEDLRRACATVIILNQDTPVAVTMSAGVAAHPASGETPLDLLDAADQALYEAKRAGRNRIVLARAHKRPADSERAKPQPRK